MNKMKIGLLRETKNPPDRRVAMPPTRATEFCTKYPDVELVVQSSDYRAFKNEEYHESGFETQKDISDCDIFFGIKEVKPETFIPGKTYFMFAHVAKKQPYNKSLLRSIMSNKITLIDYEYLTNHGRRLIAFGKWAGVVGAYNGIRTWGLRTNNFTLEPANSYFDQEQMYVECKKIKLSPIKIVLTGGGRVAGGAIETLKAFGIREITPKQLLNNEYNEAVFAKIEPWDYVEHKNNKKFELSHFFENPEQYKSTFARYTKIADLYIACHFWDPKSPVFFTQEQARSEDFKIKVIADVSCDIKNPIPSTLRASTIAEPFYDYNPHTNSEEPAFSSDKNISVMAIDNLPGELPRDASLDFSKELLNNIIPHLLGDDNEGVIARATIVKNGELTERYKYLSDWVNS